MRLPLIGSNTEGISPDADPQESVNMYLEPSGPGGRPALVRFPGLERKATIPELFATLEDDWRAAKGFFNGYEAPEGVTFTMTSSHPTGQVGMQTVTGVMEGLSADPDHELYYGRYVLGMYSFGDEYFSSNVDGKRQYYEITPEQQASGRFTLTPRLFPGVKIVRLERKVGTYPIIRATTTPDNVFNTATFVMAGRTGVHVIKGLAQIIAAIQYWVEATTGSVTYNEVVYTNGQSFLGVSGVDDYDSTGDAIIRRPFEFYDLTWVRGSDPSARDNLYRVLRGNYDEAADETTLIIRDPQPDVATGGNIVTVLPVGEAYQNRGSARSYSIARAAAGALFNLWGYRAATYDADALMLIAACCQNDVPVAEQVIETMEKKAYPLVDEGSTWAQIAGDSINGGWGTDKECVYSLATWRGVLYAGLGDEPGNNEVWSWDKGVWTQIGGDGLNDGWTAGTTRQGVKTMAVYREELYVGLGATGTGATGDGAAVWKWDGVVWTNIANSETWGVGRPRCTVLAAHNDKLYAGLPVQDDVEIWEYDGAAWTIIAGNGRNESWAMPDFSDVLSLYSHHGQLYAGMGPELGDAEVWRYDNTRWRQASGVVSSTANEVSSFATYQNNLYVGFSGGTNTAVWRYDAEENEWTSVREFETPIQYVTGLHVFEGKLYVGTGATATGSTQIWSFDGDYWMQIAGDGGDGTWSNTADRVWATIVHDEKFMIGLGSDIQGAGGTAGQADLWRQTLLGPNAHDTANFAFSCFVHGYNGSRSRGPDRVVNGNFEEGSAWTYGEGWSWNRANNTAQKSDTTSIQSRLFQTIEDGLTQGDRYVVSGVVSNWSNSDPGQALTPFVGGTNGQPVSANGPFEQIVTAGATDVFSIFATAASEFEITDIVLRALGEEEVRDGDFSMAEWEYGDGWSQNTGVSTQASNAQKRVSTAAGNLRQGLVLEEGESYWTSGTISNFVGTGETVTPSVGGQAGTAISADGPFEQEITAGAENRVQTVATAGAALELTDVSVRKNDVDDVVNGDFSAVDPWVYGTGWTYNAVNETAQKSPSSLAGLLSQPLVLTAGVAYLVTGTLSNLVGTDFAVTPLLGGTAGTALSANGPFAQTITAGTGDSIIFAATAASAFELKDVVVQLEGTEQIVDGDFTSDDPWMYGTGWTYNNANDTAQKSIAVSSGNLTQDIELVEGQDYWISGTVSAWVGTNQSVTPNVGGTAGTAITANGSFEQIITAGAENEVWFDPTDDAAFELTNVVVRNRGPEQVVDGDFDAADPWSYGTGWAYNAMNETAEKSPAASSGELTQNITLEEDATYILTGTISNWTGTTQTVTPLVGGTTGTVINGNGSFEQQIIAGATDQIQFMPSDDAAFELKNVVVRLRGTDQVIDGDFAIDDPWVYGVGWSYNAANDTAQKSTMASSGTLRQDFALDQNEDYLVSGTISNWVGAGQSVTPTLGDTTGAPLTANGAFSQTIKAGAQNQLRFSPTDDAAFELTNVVVRKKGPEQVVNGDFSAVDPWTYGEGWSWNNANRTAQKSASATVGSLTQDVALTEDVEYILTGTISQWVGSGQSVTPDLGGTAGTAITANGSFEQKIMAGSGDQIEFTPTAGAAFELTNVIARANTSELAMNGNFAQEAAWAFDNGWSIDEGTTRPRRDTSTPPIGRALKRVATEESTLKQTYADGVLKPNQLYEVSGSLNNWVPSPDALIVSLGGSFGFSVFENGRFAQLVRSGTGNELRFSAGAATVFDLTSVSVLELGDELLGNSNFAIDDPWVYGEGWSFNALNDTVQKVVSTEPSDLAQLIIPLADRAEYWITGTVSNWSGTGESVTPYVGGTAGTPITGNGAFEQKITTANYNAIWFTATADAAFELTNITLRSSGIVQVDSGNFSQSRWVYGTSWSLNSANNSAQKVSGTEAGDLSQELPLIENETYRITGTVSNWSGTAQSVTPHVGGTAGTAIAGNGAFDEEIVAGAGDQLTFTATAGSAFEITDINAHLVGPDLAIGGDFAGYDPWAYGPGWIQDAANNRVRKTISLGAVDLDQSIALNNNTDYDITGTITGWMGTGQSVTPYVGGTAGTPITGNGAFEQRIQAGTQDLIRFRASGGAQFELAAVTMRNVADEAANGMFTQGDGWTYDQGWARNATNNTAQKVVSPANANLDQAITLENNTRYWLSGTVSGWTGTNQSLTPEVGGITGTAITANGLFRQEILTSAAATNRLRFTATAGSAFQLTNIAVETLGDEEVFNGDFNLGDNWSYGAGWALNSVTNTAQKSVSATNAVLSQSITLTQNTNYRLTFYVRNWAPGSHSFTPAVGGTNGTQISSNGDFAETITAGAQNVLTFTASTGSAFELTGITLEPVEGEKVSNGDFSQDTPWTYGIGWGHNPFTSSARKSAAPTVGNLTQDFTLEQGAPYTITGLISFLVPGSSVTPYVGGAAGTAITANGPFVQRITAGAENQIRFTPTASAAFELDQFTVRKEGANQVFNGTFSQDTPWTYGIGWGHNPSSSRARKTAAPTAGTLTQDFTLEQNQTYTITFRVFSLTTTAHSVTPSVGGTAGTAVAANGTFTQHITAGAVNQIQFTSTAESVLEIDNVTLRKHGAEQVDDGNFSESDGWTYGPGWNRDVTNNRARKTAGSSGSLTQSYAPGVLVENSTYFIAGSVSFFGAGSSFTPHVGGMAGSAVTAAGAFTQEIVCGSEDTISFEATTSSVFHLTDITVNLKGDEKVADGDFTATDGWNYGEGWGRNAANNTAQKIVTSADSTLTQSFTSGVLVEGNAYLISGTLSSFGAGSSCTPAVGGTAGTAVTVAGAFEQEIVCGADDTIGFTGTGASAFQLTNVTVNLKEEKAADGNFSASDGWDYGPGWGRNSTNNTAQKIVTSAESTLTQNFANGVLVENDTYFISGTVSAFTTGQSFTPAVGGTAGTAVTVAGAFEQEIVCGADDTISFTGTAASAFQLTNVVVNSKGNETASDGDFSETDGWNYGPGWGRNAANNTAQKIVTAAESTLTQSFANGVLVENSTYLIAGTVSSFTAGQSFTPAVGGTAGMAVTAAGAFEQEIVCGADDTIGFTGTAASAFQLTNVTVNLKEEKAADGNFSASDGWDYGPGWGRNATNNTAQKIVTSAESTLTQNFANGVLVEGSTYYISGTVSSLMAGSSFTPAVGGTDGTAVTTNGAFEQLIICGADNTISFTGTGASAFNVTAVEVRLAASDLVLNGDFTADTNWVYTSNWRRNSINNTALKVPSVPFGRLQQNFADGTLTENAEYIVTGTISNWTVDGQTIGVYIGGDQAFPAVSGNGTFMRTANAGSEDFLRFDTGGPAGFEITNISLRSTTKGANLVVNGTFSQATTWAYGTGWGHNATDNRARKSPSAANANLDQTITLTDNTPYTLVFTISDWTAGSNSMTAIVGGTAGAERSANGTYTQTITAGTADTLRFTGSPGSDFELSNVSLFEKGANLVVNGTFSQATTWAYGTGWGHNATDNRARKSPSAANANLDQTITLTDNAPYVLTFTVSDWTAASNSMTAIVGGTAGTERSANGTYTQTITAGTGNLLRFTGSPGSDFELSNVSLVGRGANIVVNGTFSQATTWTYGTGWGHNATDNRARKSVSAANANLDQAITLTDNTPYTLVFTISDWTAGMHSMTGIVGGTAGTERSANGTYTQTITAGTADTLRFTGSPGSNFELDNVSLFGRGANLVVNGTFSQATTWAYGTGWGHNATNNKARKSPSAANANLDQTTTLTDSTPYVLTFTVSDWTAGMHSMTGIVGGTAGAERSANGTYTQTITAGTADTLRFTGSPGSNFELDNVSLFEKGSDLVVNGDFSEATSWTFNPGWASHPTNNTAVKSITGALANLDQTIALDNSTDYFLSFTVSNWTAGMHSMTAYVGGTTGPEISANGTYRQLVRTGTADLLRFTASPMAAFSLSNVSLRALESDLVTDGDFLQNDGWNYGIGWGRDVANDKAQHWVTTTFGNIHQGIALDNFVDYVLVYTISDWVGTGVSMTAQLGGTDGREVSGNGTYAEVIRTGTVDDVRFNASAGASFKLDDIGVHKLDANLVTDGDFLQNDGWNYGIGWGRDAANDKAQHWPTSAISNIHQGIALDADAYHLVTFTISDWVGTGQSMTVQLGTNVGREISANGTYTRLLRAHEAVAVRFNASAGASFKLTNVSVRRLDSNLVLDGNFNSQDGWQYTPGWKRDAANNKAEKTVSTSNAVLYQNIFKLENYADFVLTFTVSDWAATNASMTPQLAGTNGSEVSANGTYTQLISGTNIDVLGFTASANAVFRLDNVSVRVVERSLVVNGDFSRGDSWIYSPGWHPNSTNNTAQKSASTANATLGQNANLTEGRSYYIGGTVSNWSVANQSVTPHVGGMAGTEISANGTFEQLITAGSTDLIQFTASTGAAFELTNVTFRERGPDVVDNGMFARDAGWNFDGGWSWNEANESAKKINANQLGFLYQDLELVSNQNYIVRFTVSEWGGSNASIFPSLGFGGFPSGAAVSANGTYTQTLRAGEAPQYLWFVASVTALLELKDVSLRAEGPNLVYNSSFEGDPWTFGTGWAWNMANDTAQKTVSAATTYLDQSIVLEDSTAYWISGTISGWSGTGQSVTPWVGGTAGQEISSNGVFLQSITTGSVDQIRFEASAGSAFEITDITLDQRGADQVLNGDFSTSDSWQYGTGWALNATDEKAQKTVSESVGNLDQPVVLTSNQAYTISGTVSNWTAGFHSFTPYVGGQIGTAVSANGTFSQTITAGTDNLIRFTASSGAAFELDNVSLRQAGDSSSAPTSRARRSAPVPRAPSALALSGDLVMDGTFSAGDGWNYGVGWSRNTTNDTAQKVDATMWGRLDQTITLVENTDYTVSGTISNWSVADESVTPWVGARAGSAISANGAFEQTIEAGNENSLRFDASDKSAFELDNVSLRGTSGNVVSNSDFSNNDPWVYGLGWAHNATDSTAQKSVSAAIANLDQAITLVEDQDYTLTGTVSNWTAGAHTLTPYVGNEAGTAISANGVFDQTIEAGAEDLLRFGASLGSAFELTGVSLRTLGPDLVTNGGFSEVSVWTYGTGWSRNAANNTAQKVVSVSFGALSQPLTLTENSDYTVTGNVSNWTPGAHSFTPVVGGQLGSAISANGAFEQTIEAGGMNQLQFNPSTGSAFELANVTLRLIGPDLVVNGDFSKNSPWVYGTGWARNATDNTAQKSVSAAVANLDQVITLTEDTDYTITGTVSNWTAGAHTLTPYVGNEAGTAISANGGFTQTIEAGAEDLLRFAASENAAFELTGISLRQRGPDLIVNGDFTAFDPWVYGTGFSRNSINNTAQKVVTEGFGRLSQDVTLTDNTAYTLSATVSNWSTPGQSFTPYVGGQIGSAISGNGAFTQTITAGNEDQVRFDTNAGAAFEITAISLRTRATNLVINGDFSAHDPWAYGSGWALNATDNTAQKTVSVAVANLDQEVPLVEDTDYQLAGTVSNWTAGAHTLTPSVGGTGGTAISADGAFSQTIEAGAGGLLRFAASAGSAFELTGVSLRGRGPEMVVDGDFAQPPIWNYGSAWSRNVTTLSASATSTTAQKSVSASFAQLDQVITLTQGQRYIVSGTVTNWSVSGQSFTPYVGGMIGREISGNGSFEQIIEAGDENLLRFTASAGSAFELSNISLRSIGLDLIDNGDFTMGDPWEYGTGWAYNSTNDTAQKTPAASFGLLTQPFAPGLLEENEEYWISGTVLNWSSPGESFTPYVGGLPGAGVNANGDFAQKIMAGVESNIFFAASAAAAFELTDVVLRRVDEKILAADPYFRNGASAWDAKAYGFYLQKYPQGRGAPTVRRRCRELLDHMIDEYMVRLPNHPQQYLLRGGKGQYDIWDPSYIWHPGERVLWCSLEHHWDTRWALQYADAAGLISDSRALAEMGLTYGSLLAILDQKFKTDVSEGGFYLETKKRHAQGITAQKVVQVEASDRKFHVASYQMALLTPGFRMNIAESADPNNDGVYTVESSVASTTPIASGTIQDDRYYIVTGTEPVIIEYDTNQYGTGQQSRIFSGREGVRTFTVVQGTPVVQPFETVVTVIEPVASDVPHTTGPDRDGVIVFPDQAGALDLTSWGMPPLVSMGDEDLARTIEPFLDNYLVTDAGYNFVKGYKPYLQCIPDTELYPGQSLSDAGCMLPWSAISYPDSEDTVWYEGTGGVMLAYGAIRDWTKYERIFWNAYPGREIADGGYPYTTRAVLPYEMTDSASLASTTTMVIAQDPKNFWEVSLPGDLPDRSTQVPVRGLHVMDGVLYGVLGNLVFGFDNEYRETLINTQVINTSVGPVQMADNGTQLMISDGTNQSYLYDSTDKSWTVLNEEAGFFAGGSAAQIDSLFISHDPTTQAIYWSNVNDGKTWNALDTSSAYVQSGDIVAVIVDHREVWVFKTETTEIFFNSGDAELTFVRLPSGALEHGCAAQHSVAKIDNAVFWLAHDLTIRRAQGITPLIVSTTHVVAHWRAYTRVDDAYAFGYVDQGHTYYQITFPSAGETWIYDITMKIWMRRASFIRGLDEDGAHRASSYARFNNQNVMGDYEKGYLYELDPETHTDDEERIIWRRRLPTVIQERKPFFIRRVEIEMEAPGRAAPSSANPTLLVRTSRDQGHTWGTIKQIPMGPSGDYANRAVLRRLGRARSWTLELQGSEPVKTVITDAHAQIESGDR